PAGSLAPTWNGLYPSGHRRNGEAGGGAPPAGRRRAAPCPCPAHRERPRPRPAPMAARPTGGGEDLAPCDPTGHHATDRRRRRPDTMPQLPVIALTGLLGAGKTTLLNRLLRAPGARLGVVVNDFGAINVDAGLVMGQVDEAEAISGGCVCCLPDAGGLDAALEKLAQPRLRLDAVIVEASGVADPPTLARLIRFSEVDRIRPGGVVDVIDAAEHFETVDTGVLPPERYAAATLIVVNKTDRIPGEERDAVRRRIVERVRERNPLA